MVNIRKRFGANVVLSNASIDVLPGEVHILAGENGAGKSTLIRILAGVYQDWEGEIFYFGESRRLRSTHEARDIGVSVIHQELSLVPDMTIVENLFLGRNATRYGFVRRSEQMRAARTWLNRVGLDVPADTVVGRLSLAAQQLVEIAKALATDARVIVMDEPTSALSHPDAQRLFQLVADLKGDGHGIVYITHRLEEIEQLADRITVLRDGAYIGTRRASELPMNELFQWMAGMEIARAPARASRATGHELLRLDGFGVAPGRGGYAVRETNLTLRRGEVVGLAGLQGSGASELIEGLFGAHGRNVTGSIQLNGRPITNHSPRESIQNRFAMVPGDRKVKGLNLKGSIHHNSILAVLPKLARSGWRRTVLERRRVADQAESLRLKAPGLDALVSQLSGGNQQKVVLAKWLLTDPLVLLLDEPTRGVDVGAKEEIYGLIDDLAATGMGVLLYSSDLPELLRLSERIVVLHRGEVTATLARGEATADNVLAAAMGRTESASTQ